MGTQPILEPNCNHNHNCMINCLCEQTKSSQTSLIVPKKGRYCETFITFNLTHQFCLIESMVPKFNAELFFLEKTFGGQESFLWGHWYPYFGLLVTSSLGFKARVGSALFELSGGVPVMLHVQCRTYSSRGVSEIWKIGLKLSWLMRFFGFILLFFWGGGVRATVFNFKTFIMCMLRKIKHFNSSSIKVFGRNIFNNVKWRKRENVTDLWP